MEETEGMKSCKGLETDGANNTQRDCGRRMNPLDITVIARTIASYIDKVEDLKGLRILSRAGTEETFTTWRNSAVFLINNETLPLLLTAYSKQNWDELSEEEKDRIDPFQLRQVPFKKYRFSREQSWAYPLEDNELDKKLIWQKVIQPNATYLDIGESAMKWYPGNREDRRNYNYGLYWIVINSKNVKELAMAPVRSLQELKEEPEDSVEINDFYNNLPTCMDFNQYINEVHQATQLESLTISMPVMSADEEKIKPLFSIDGVFGLWDEEYVATKLAMNLFSMTPYLKNFQLKQANSREARCVLRGLELPEFGIPRIFLQSLDILEVQTTFLPYILNHYTENMRTTFWINHPQKPNLQQLKMSCTFSDCVKFDFRYLLLCCNKTLTRLELKIDCEMKNNERPPIETGLYMADFPNLVHFKVNLEYKTFPGRLPTFNLNDLGGMPSLQEFHFGTNGNLVDKDWITRKLKFKQYPSDPQDVRELPQLKSFHFHGNFTKKALQKLGSMMVNLKTLEVVLDKENFSAVREIWPELKNLKLLPCSDVPVEDLKALEDSNPSWNVINESANYLQCVMNEILDGVAN